MDAIDVARFWSNVEAGDIRKCWPWRRKVDRSGYGAFRINGKNQAAHRWAFLLIMGDYFQDKVIRHKCDNPSCCNPYHLLVGTHAENVADRVMRDRSARGERNGRSKLTDDQVRQIRADPRPSTIVGPEYGITPASASNIRAGRTWAHVA